MSDDGAFLSKVNQEFKQGLNMGPQDTQKWRRVVIFLNLIAKNALSSLMFLPPKHYNFKVSTSMAFVIAEVGGCSALPSFALSLPNPY